MIDDDFNWSEFSEDMRAESMARRAGNRANSANILTASGVAFTTNNAGAHLIVTYGKRVVDFWPGTGKYIHRKTNAKGRGVFNLLRDLGVKPQGVKNSQLV